MPAVLLVWDVLRELEDPNAIVASLVASGLCPVVLAVDGASERQPGGLGCDVVVDASGRPECWLESRALLPTAVAACGAPAGATFLVCAEPGDVSAAMEVGLRPVLVLQGRTLEGVFGSAEPAHKDACVAPDLDTALRYVTEEAAQDAALGAFPYGERATAETRVQALVPSPRDLAALFALVILAGVAVALGIAYLLQEVYQRVHLPPIAYWLTLQFIPQALRGALFLAIGALAGLMVRPTLSRLSRRYRARHV